VNADWHKANPMPKNPTSDQRVEWHREHSLECGCREMPADIAGEIKLRGDSASNN